MGEFDKFEISINGLKPIYGAYTERKETENCVRSISYLGRVLTLWRWLRLDGSYSLVLSHKLREKGVSIEIIKDLNVIIAYWSSSDLNTSIFCNVFL